MRRKLALWLSGSLALGFFVLSCSNSVSSTSETIAPPIVVNGWSLFSDTGTRAIEEGTAELVCAVKEVYSQDFGGNVVVSVKGNLESVLDRVNDPFFGPNSDVNLNDPKIKEYLEKIAASPQPDLTSARTHYVTLTVEPATANSSRGTTIFGFNNTTSVYQTAGTSFTWTMGFSGLGPIAGTVIHDVTPSGQVDCVLYNQSAWDAFWGGGWSENARSNDITIYSGQVNTPSNFAFGWYGWKAVWYWDSDARIIVGLSW